MTQQRLDAVPAPPEPAWLPSWVASRRQAERAEAAQLHPAQALADLAEALTEASAFVGQRDLHSDLEQAAAYRHVLVLLALALDELLRRSDSDHPHLKAGNVDAVLKWGMDCPDAAYLGASLRGERTYRLHGRRGGARYLGLQVMAGIEAAVNVVADDLSAADGTLDVLLVPEGTSSDAAHLVLPAGASSLVVRQFFYDWEHEEPASLMLDMLSPPRTTDPQTGPVGTSSKVAGGVAALGQFLMANLRFWCDMEDQLQAKVANGFQPPAARTDLGGAAENVTVWGSWAVGQGEALVVEVIPPVCRYWSLALGNRWWESLDYTNHQTSLNGHQGVLDPDGVFRAVVAHEDPGVANWLDTTGLKEGPMIFRFVEPVGSVPVAKTELVDLHQLGSVLPPATPAVSPQERASVIDARRRGVRRRFAR